MSGKDWLSDEAAKHKHTLADDARLEALNRPTMEQQLKPLSEEQKQAAMDELRRQGEERRGKFVLTFNMPESLRRLLAQFTRRD